MTTTLPGGWIWPSNDEINDFPDPLGFEAEWKPWLGTMADPDGSVLAEIFVRELIQNSWDSIQERTKGLSSSVTGDRGVVFRFVRLEGADARDFVMKFGLDGHAARFEGMSTKHQMDSRLDDSLVASGNVDSLTVLVVSERWGKGMWGPWRTGGKAGVVSRLKSALIQTKSEKQNAGSGGSWGHGKKGIANASMCRTLAVYTCSEPVADDATAEGDPITRRLLGVSYWRSHDLDDRAHVGLGLLGTLSESGEYQGFTPFENTSADDVVDGLGIPGFDVRDPSRPGDTGVSYLLVEPSFTLDQLRRALIRNWWPLLLDNPDALQLFDEAGMKVSCSPEDMPELDPFRHAYGIATGRMKPTIKTETCTEIFDNAFGPVGRLGLTSDVREDGWSFAEPESNATLVALVRNDMVIAYQQFPLKTRGKPPFLRGVFVVDRAENERASEGLKMAEPHLHNEWTTKPSPSVPKKFAELANRTLGKIANDVARLKTALRDDSTKIRSRFTEFSRNWAVGPSVSKSGRDKILPRTPRDYSITYEADAYDVDANVSDPTLLRVKVTMTLALQPGAGAAGDGLTTAVQLGWGVREESGATRDPSLHDPTDDVIPDGFVLDGDRYVGKVTTDPIKFTWTSRFFPDDWQVVAYPEVQKVIAPNETTQNDQQGATQP